MIDQADGGPTLLWDISEVARQLGCSTKSAWRLDEQGKLPKSVRVGVKLKRWRSREIAAWVAAGCPDRLAWHWPPEVSDA